MLGESSHSGGGRIKFFQDDVMFFLKPTFHGKSKKNFQESSFPIFRLQISCRDLIFLQECIARDRQRIADLLIRGC